MYLKAAADIMEKGIRPRCHLEDVTRADVFDFVIPEYMSHHGFLTTATAFDMLPDKKAVETLNEAYLFAQSTTIRSIAAFKAYRKTRDKKIRKEIQKNYLLTALSIITFTNED